MDKFLSYWCNYDLLASDAFGLASNQGYLPDSGVPEPDFVIPPELTGVLVLSGG